MEFVEEDDSALVEDAEEDADDEDCDEVTDEVADEDAEDDSAEEVADDDSADDDSAEEEADDDSAELVADADSVDEASSCRAYRSAPGSAAAVLSGPLYWSSTRAACWLGFSAPAADSSANSNRFSFMNSFFLPSSFLLKSRTKSMSNKQIQPNGYNTGCQSRSRIAQIKTVAVIRNKRATNGQINETKRSESNRTVRITVASEYNQSSGRFNVVYDLEKVAIIFVDGRD